jgi:UDPglucose 6-dehydrogenase
MHNFKEKYEDKVSYCNNEYEVSKDADALLILTEWNEYRSLDLRRIKSAMKSPYIFDTRNVLDRDELNELGFSFDLIGQKTMEA